MAAPAMSYLICSMALVALILILPGFFAIEYKSVAEEMATKELTEISDYTSNTLQNLYLLANSTNSGELTLKKELLYLPSRVEGSPYTLRISSDSGGNALQVTAYIADKSWVEGFSWLVPGLKILPPNNPLTINERAIFAVCQREADVFYIWMEEGE